MKRVVLFISMLMLGGFYAEAQSISPHAIGLRFGGGQGYGAEISYQHGMGSNNRVELDLGWSSSDTHDSFKLEGLYHWVGGFTNEFYWFLGAGAGLGSWSNSSDNDGFNVAVAGQAGLEYNFSFPLQLTLDIRPNLWLLSGTDFHWGDIALGARYQF